MKVWERDETARWVFPFFIKGGGTAGVSMTFPSKRCDLQCVEENELKTWQTERRYERGVKEVMGKEGGKIP